MADLKVGVGSLGPRLRRGDEMVAPIPRLAMNRTSVLSSMTAPWRPSSSVATPYAELHCHSHFSFLDGASAPTSWSSGRSRSGWPGWPVTDHQGLYGAVRFVTAAEAVGLRPVIGIEIELLDPAVPDPGGIVVRRPRDPGAPGGDRTPPSEPPAPVEASGPATPERTRLPGHRTVVKEDHRGIGEAERGPHLVLLARDDRGWQPVPAGVAREPRRVQGVPAVHPGAARRAHRGRGRAVGLPSRRDRAPAAGRRPRGRAGGRRAVRRAVRGAGGADGAAPRASSSGAPAPPAARRRLAGRETARLADELGLPSSSPTTSTTRRPRIASSTTS